jgi:hypothetical protein
LRRRGTRHQFHFVDASAQALAGALTYAVCAGCFLLGACGLIPVATRYAESRAADAGSMWRRFGIGIRFIRQRPIILGAISLDLFTVLLGGVVALLPIYAKEILHVGPEGLGALRSAIAIGEVSAGLWLSMRPFNHAVGKRMFIAVAIFGAAILAGTGEHRQRKTELRHHHRLAHRILPHAEFHRPVRILVGLRHGKLRFRHADPRLTGAQFGGIVKTGVSIGFGAQYGIAVFAWGKDGWTGSTTFLPTPKTHEGRATYFKKQRVGRLLFKK